MRLILFVVILICTLFSCKQKNSTYATFSGKITMPNSDSLQITGQEIPYRKIIKLNKDGTFSDTIRLHQSFATIYDGTESTTLYFKNGYNLNMTLNTLEFDETVSFTGEGANTNQKIVDLILFREKMDNDNSYYELSKERFEEKIDHDINVFMTKIAADTSLDSIFLNRFKNSFKNLKERLSNEYNIKNQIN